MLKPKIFISYRRTDASAFAGRIYDRLQGEFGDGAIFMDVDSIDAGDNFQHSVQDAINSSVVFLAIIGRTWASVTDSAGKQRLHEPDDHVRREVSMALQADVQFFPVLVDGADMPEKGSIPSEIQQIVNLNAIQISHEKFREDISTLITAISKKTGPQPGRGVDERLSRLRAAMMSTTSTWELERISYELDEVMKIDPTNVGAKQLQRMVQDARVYHESSGSACSISIIHPSNYESCLIAFLYAHVLGVLQRELDPIRGQTVWRITYAEVDNVGKNVGKAVTDELPGHRAARMLEPYAGPDKLDPQEYSKCIDIWSLSHERVDAAVKLGWIIKDHDTYMAALEAAVTKVMSAGGHESYRQKLIEYAGEGGALAELEENDQRFLREIVTKQVNDND